MNPAIEKLNTILGAARAEVAKVPIGQEQAVELALITLLTRHHALIEGVPGVAKTLLVRTLGQVLGVASGRVQFTPDLMPADITGTNVFNLQTNQFTLIRGPVFTAFLLADEINRAPAKTQAALLQAMQERAVSIDRDTHVLDENFTVFATQNPADSEGTYPLPEAQKDRFMVKIKMEAPGRDDELTLARRMLGADAPETILGSGALRAVLGTGELAAARAALPTVTMREELAAYTVDLVRRPARMKACSWAQAPGPRRPCCCGGRARAALEGRDFVTPDDVRGLAGEVLGHRLVLRPEFEIEGLTIDEVHRPRTGTGGGAALNGVVCKNFPWHPPPSTLHEFRPGPTSALAGILRRPDRGGAAGPMPEFAGGLLAYAARPRDLLAALADGVVSLARRAAAVGERTARGAVHARIARAACAVTFANPGRRAARLRFALGLPAQFVSPVEDVLVDLPAGADRACMDWRCTPAPARRTVCGDAGVLWKMSRSVLGLWLLALGVVVRISRAPESAGGTEGIWPRCFWPAAGRARGAAHAGARTRIREASRLPARRRLRRDPLESHAKTSGLCTACFKPSARRKSM